MKLTTFSKDRLYHNLINDYRIPDEWAEPLFNYLVHGWEPGGFFTSFLANDMLEAIRRSHPANTVSAMKAVTTWILNAAPKESYGSHDAVEKWCQLDEDIRRSLLERSRLIYPEDEEIMYSLKGSKWN